MKAVKELPKIDIIIPVYKVEKYLARCIYSVLAQQYTEFSVILVDDGSPDRCGDICEEFAATDQRIHVIHRENGGLSVARNTGIEWALANSKSEWITFIDSDDWIHPQYLAMLYAAVTRTGLAVAVGSFKCTETETAEKLNEIQSNFTISIVNTEDFYCSNKVTATIACGKLYRKRDFETIRYPERRIHEDEFTTHRILFRYQQIALVDYPIYMYYQNPQSIMGSGWNPKHIAECDGMLEQVRFFDQNRFYKAKRYVSGLYLTCLYKNLCATRQDKASKQDTRRLLHRLRAGLIRYGKLSGMTISTAPWMYFEAFRTLSLPYRAYRKLFVTMKN